MLFTWDCGSLCKARNTEDNGNCLEQLENARIAAQTDYKYFIRNSMFFVWSLYDSSSLSVWFLILARPWKQCVISTGSGTGKVYPQHKVKVMCKKHSAVYVVQKIPERGIKISKIIVLLGCTTNNSITNYFFPNFVVICWSNWNEIVGNSSGVSKVHGTVHIC